MRSFRSPTIVVLTLLCAWFAFVLTQYTRKQLEMRSIAKALRMDYRTFSILPGPLNPSTAIDGEERLLVVGESNDDFLVCSIVRNPLCSDARSEWRVDCCFRPDLNPGYPRTSIWMPFDHFPNELELQQFRLEALKQPWVRWDHPEGTDPEFEFNESLDE